MGCRMADADFVFRPHGKRYEAVMKPIRRWWCARFGHTIVHVASNHDVHVFCGRCGRPSTDDEWEADLERLGISMTDEG